MTPPNEYGVRRVVEGISGCSSRTEGRSDLRRCRRNDESPGGVGPPGDSFSIPPGHDASAGERPGCPYFLIRPSSFMITSYSTIFFFTRAREASGPMNSVLKPL